MANSIRIILLLIITMASACGVPDETLDTERSQAGVWRQADGGVTVDVVSPSTYFILNVSATGDATYRLDEGHAVRAQGRAQVKWDSDGPMTLHDARHLGWTTVEFHNRLLTDEPPCAVSRWKVSINRSDSECERIGTHVAPIVVEPHGPVGVEPHDRE